MKRDFTASDAGALVNLVADTALSTEGAVNAKWFGAVGDGATDDTAALQQAIDVVRALGKGAEVYLPYGTYQVSSTLEIGGADEYIDGFSIRGAGRSMAGLHTTINWIGADDGGPILRVRNACGGTIEDLSFNGRALAKECVQFTHVSGDSGIASMWRVVGCRFSNAKEHNVLIGERSGTQYGDCSCITFDNCYFAPSQAGCETESHLRQRAQYTFGTTLVNCRFASDGTFYPARGISVQGGTVTMFGGALDLQGECSIYLDGVDGVPFPAVCVYSVEAQSANRFLTTNFAGGGSAAQRATVLSGVSHSDISGDLADLSIYWDVPWFGALLLDGCRFQFDVEIASSDAKVFSHGTIFDVGKTFTGAGAHKVEGTWLDGGTIGGTWHHRKPALPEYADNAAAEAAGLEVGDLYRTATGVVMARY